MSAALERRDAPVDAPVSPAPVAPPTTGEHPPLVPVGALAAYVGRAFPVWTIWWAHGIWYATGPCPDQGCACSRTLHAPDPSGLCQQLDEQERRARAVS